jgi:fatty acid desaturase
MVYPLGDQAHYMVSPRHTKRIHALTAIDGARSLLTIAVDYMAVIAVASGAVVLDHPATTLAAVLLIAGRQMAFLNLVHAAAHYTLFTKRQANNRVDLFVGYAILEPVRPYRAVHLRHHRELSFQSPNRFDYLYEHMPPPDAGVWQRTWTIILKPLCGWAGVHFLLATIRTAVMSPRIGVSLLAFWTVVIAAFWGAGALGELVVFWWLPLFCVYPVFVFWAELSDHYAARDEARNQAGVFYSTFIKGHEMYHAVHHRYPRIPFYRIKAAAEQLRSDGERFEESRGVVDFLRILYRTPRSVDWPQSFPIAPSGLGGRRDGLDVPRAAHSHLSGRFR